MIDGDGQGILIAKSPVIVLVEPQLGENIGTAARAMANFGLSSLRLVKPRDGWPSETASKAASGANWVIENAEIFDSVESAISDLGLVYATTARPRDMIKPVVGPNDAADAIIAVANEKESRRAGLLFGRERWGLTNDEIALADQILTYPVNPEFASLNIAQAVLLFGHVWFSKASSQTMRDGFNVEAPPLAAKEDLFRLFIHLEDELDRQGFLRPVEKRARMVNTLRNILHRAKLSESDVRTLRGVIVSLTNRKASRDLKERDLDLAGMSGEEDA